MEKLNYIIAYNGVEVIDATEESINRANDINYMFERAERERRFKRNRRSILTKLVSACGIL